MVARFADLNFFVLGDGEIEFVLGDNDGAYSIYGNFGSNRLFGNKYDNTIHGGAGADNMIGGDGNDTYYVDDMDDIAIEAENGGIDHVFSLVSYFLITEGGDQVENLTLTGNANSNAVGNNLANVITGNSGKNVLGGGRGDDRIFGGGESDNVYGGVGNDFLDGGEGADLMIGGEGNDICLVDNAADAIEELANGGIDTVISSVTYSFDDDAKTEFEDLILSGTAALNGTGNAKGNTLTGNIGANVLSGLDGNDVLVGGYGNDVLAGGAGSDSFVFNAKLGSATSDRKVNFDKIADFNVAADTIQLENKVFTKLKKTKTIDKAYFQIGSKADDKDDYILYNKKTGVLSYDSDGSGSRVAIEIAHLSKNLKLTYKDFYII